MGEDRAAVVVCVSAAIDTSSPLDFAALLTARGTFSEAGRDDLPWILNPADEAAVCLARGLRGHEEVVLGVHVGPPASEPILRNAVAVGIDRAVRLELPAGEAQEAPAVAEALARFVGEAEPEWVLCGQATLDWRSGLVGPTLSELLGWPYVDHLLEISREGPRQAGCLRYVGRGVREEVRVRAPAVLAVSPLVFRPVSPTMRRRLLARRMTIPVRPASISGELLRPARRELTRPRPRPRERLPGDFGKLSGEGRLAMLLQWGQPSESRSLRWLESDPDAAARQILDFIEAEGAWKPAAGR